MTGDRPEGPRRTNRPQGADPSVARDGRGELDALDDSRLRALGLSPLVNPPEDRVDDRANDPLDPVDGGGLGGGSVSGLAASPAGRLPDTPLWLSHHWPDDYDRCAVVGGLHVCRRCLVLYPLALVAGIAISIGSWWDHGWDPWILWLLPLPGVIEFVLDNLRIIRYRPVRQVVLSAGGAIAAGVGYVRYLDDTTDALAWSVLAVYTAVTLSAAIAGGLWKRRRRPAPVTDGAGR